MTKKKPEPEHEFPYVTCKWHEGKHLSFAVCIHVAGGQSPISYFDPATSTNMGAAACHACAQLDTIAIDDLRVICERCMLPLIARSMQQ